MHIMVNIALCGVFIYFVLCVLVGIASMFFHSVILTGLCSTRDLWRIMQNTWRPAQLKVTLWMVMVWPAFALFFLKMAGIHYGVLKDKRQSIMQNYGRI